MGERERKRGRGEYGGGDRRETGMRRRCGCGEARQRENKKTMRNVCSTAIHDLPHFFNVFVDYFFCCCYYSDLCMYVCMNIHIL